MQVSDPELMLQSYAFTCCQEKHLDARQRCMNERLNSLYMSIPTEKNYFGLVYDQLASYPKLSCSIDIEKRGNNNVVTPQNQNHASNRFLITPCGTPTYKNNIRCDEEKCCSKQHQLFDNWTKAKNQ